MGDTCLASSYLFHSYYQFYVQVEYSQRQIKDLLSMINAGNMPNKNRPYEATNRGLHRSISAYGIVGKLANLIYSLLHMC